MSDSDFMKAIMDSQGIPEFPEELKTQIPDMLTGPKGPELIQKVTEEEASEGKIPGANTYSFEYKCARFQMGQVMDGFSNGQPTFTEIDDSNFLKEIMDKNLAGEAVITKKTETFLKDGTVVVWCEWLEPKKQVPREERSYLTQDELLSPELTNNETESHPED